MVFSLSSLWWIRGLSYLIWRIRGLWELPDGRDWLWGKLGLVLMGMAMLSKSLTQFSVYGQGWLPFLLFDLRPNYGGGNVDNADFLQKVPCMHCYTQCPQPCSRPPLAQDSARESWTLTGKSVSVLWGHYSFLLSPGAQKFVFVPSKSLFPQSCISSGGFMVGLVVTSSKSVIPYHQSRNFHMEAILLMLPKFLSVNVLYLA